MPEAVIIEFEGVSRRQYNAVNDKLGIDTAAGTGDWPKGLTSHVAGETAGGGFVVMEVWDSQASHEAWMGGRLGVALGEVGVPAPVRVAWVDVVGEHRA
jgi:hypothetical protein